MTVAFDIRRPSKPASITFPPHSFTSIATFLWQILLALPQQAPVWSLIEAGIILAVYILSFGFLVELLVDRSRRKSPVDQSWLQQAVVKITQIAFSFFDYRLGRVVFSERACLALMHNRFGGKQLFDRYCAKVTTEIEGQPLEGWWIASPGRARNLAEGRSGGGKSYTLLYLPGGGFVMGGPTFYLEFLHKLRIALSLSHPSLGDVAIFAASYPLVPEHTHPAQAESARRTWSYLASHPGVDPARLSAAGDSAGGHLALGLRLAVGNTSLPDFELYEGLPLPHQLILLSPFIELNFTAVPSKSSSLSKNRSFDFVDPTNLGFFAQLFSGVSKPSDQPSGLIAFLRRKTTFAFIYPASSPSSATAASALRRRRRSMTSAAQSLHALHCKADPLLSPGDHASRLLSSSTAGSVPTLVLYGAGEVMADQSERLLKALGDQGEGRMARQCHAWPLVLFNLGRSNRERGLGVLEIAQWIAAKESKR